VMHFTVTGSIAPVAIPTSLHASLLARLDRLAPLREAFDYPQFFTRLQQQIQY